MSDHLSERVSMEVQIMHNRCMSMPMDEEQKDQVMDMEGGDGGNGGLALGGGDWSQEEGQCGQERA